MKQSCLTAKTTSLEILCHLNKKITSKTVAEEKIVYIYICVCIACLLLKKAKACWCLNKITQFC